MNIEVLNTGTELLLGNVINRHVAYFGQQLFPLGLRIQRQVTVPDGSPIRDALFEAFSRCDILLVTGGLGPTTDDITREVTAQLLSRRLAESADVTAAIAARLQRRGIPYRARMQRQAMVPEGATVLPNENGTAPGLYLPATHTSSSATPHLFLLPGPPRELIPMFEGSVIPLLKAIIGTPPSRLCRTYHVVGMGESAVEEVIGLSLDARGDLEVGYCARPNEVDFRLIGDAATLDEVEPAVLAALGTHLAGRDGASLEEGVVRRLIALGQTLATAESCTGGLLASRITNVPGASEIFLEGFVTYANESKIRNLNVPAKLIEEYGAVSEQVARAMAEGVMVRSGTNFGVGITGIAGPGGGTPEKPMGTVFIAVAQRGGSTECRRELFPSDRETFKQLSTQSALDLLRLKLP
ncbi:competence/damage-inducible protein A [soil metagenome]